MIPQEIVSQMTLAIRDTVRPHLGGWLGRTVTGTAASGDATFGIDDIAETAIVEFIEEHELSVAYYSEDKGLVKYGDAPEGVLVIDPIDGTRPALAGFEQCVVAVSWTDYTEQPTMGDVHYACIAELKQDDLFFAERGKGASWVAADGSDQPVRLSPITQLSDAPLSFEAVARPFQYLGVVLNEIVNTASMTGGCFLYNSTAYSLTRLVTGQLSGVLDVGNLIFRDHAWSRSKFRAVGRGKAIGLFTYDIAAAALIAEEAGAVVTDAYGNSFRDIALLDTSENNIQSICAAANPTLHAQLLAAVKAGSARLREV